MHTFASLQNLLYSCDVISMSQLQQLQQPHPQIPIHFHTTSGARLAFTLQANLAAATAVNTNKLAGKIIWSPVMRQHEGQRYIDIKTEEQKTGEAWERG